MKDTAIQGLLHASPEKRYKSFLNTVADRQDVWLLFSEEGYATLDLDGFVHVLVWPRKEFCSLYQSDAEKAVAMEVHDFIEKCEELEESVRFMVFPTNENCYIVTAQQLREDLQIHLEELE